MSAVAIWTPILCGSVRDAAIESATGIVSSVLDHALPKDPSLYAECSILLRYASLSLERPDLESEVGRFTHLAAEAMADARLGPGLHGGFVGIAWALRHLYSAAPWFADERPTSEIDEAMDKLLERASTPLMEYDLIGGLVGVGVYLLGRLPDSNARLSLDRVIDHLTFLSIAQEAGVTWFRAPPLLGPLERLPSPDGHFNLGIAHGVPGILAFLARAYACGIRRERTERLLRGGASWVLGQMTSTEGARFPSVVQPGEMPRAARSAWCYGDPGVLVALYAVANALGDPELTAKSLDLARASAMRPAEECGVKDAGLCHGAAGLGHLYNRFFQCTRDELFAEVARAWFERALAMRQTGAPFDGYRVWGTAAAVESEPEWADDPGLLTGATGIGLALIAASTNVLPSWDQLLLLDLASSEL
jgi:lantibiotic modifying enzyme